MKVHPFAEIFPGMSDQAFEELKADIKEKGLVEPVWTYHDQIIDGRHRFRACKELGLPCETRAWQGKDLIGFVISTNLRRRHLTTSQRAMVAATIANMAKGRPEKKKEAKPPGNKGKKNSRHRLLNNSESKAKVTQPTAAKALNVAVSTVKVAAAVQKKGAPELVQAVKDGQVTVTEAERISELPKPEQVEVVAKGPKAIAKKAAQLKEEKDKASGKSLVNGHLVDDPKHIAALRKKGKLAPGIIPEVTDPVKDNTEPEPEKDEKPDEEWLEELPLTKILKGGQLRWFKLDALLYRTLEDARRKYRFAAMQGLAHNKKQGGNGWFAFMVQQFLKIEHPRGWTRCAPLDKGGCNGTGEVKTIGKCEACQGRGYRIK